MSFLSPISFAKRKSSINDSFSNFKVFICSCLVTSLACFVFSLACKTSSSFKSSSFIFFFVFAGSGLGFKPLSINFSASSSCSSYKIAPALSISFTCTTPSLFLNPEKLGTVLLSNFLSDLYLFSFCLVTINCLPISNKSPEIFSNSNSGIVPCSISYF